MSNFQEIEISIYRQGKCIAKCPLQLQADPSEQQDLIEYNREDVAQAIIAAIEADRNTPITETTVQNPFTHEEVWEDLFTDGDRASYFIEYE